MKDKLRLLILVIPIALPSMVSAGYASVNDTNTTEDIGLPPYQYISPTPGEFPIIGWGLYFDTARSVFKDFVDCGFNAALIIPRKSNVDALMTALNTINNNDTLKLNLILHMRELMDNYEPEQSYSLMNTFLYWFRKYLNKNKHIKITGWFLEDEPIYYQFFNWSRYFHNMAQHDTTRMSWANLMGDPRATGFLYLTDPITSTNDHTIIQLPKTASYREYIENFSYMLRPGVLSYDYYPIGLDSKGKDVTITKNRLDDFYTSLQMYSEISKKRGCPFWAFCQSRATGLDSNYNRIGSGHPAPTETFLRYEAFNALAFGDQGTEYWSYKEEFPFPKDSVRKEYYALATYEGEKTPLWNYARNVNREIKAFTRVFLGAKLKSYYFVGDKRDTNYDDYKIAKNTDPIIVKSFRPALDTVGSNHGALVSTLTNGIDKYVVIVNQSPYDNASLLVTLNNRDYKISELKYQAGSSSEYLEVSSSKPTIQSLKISLEPSQYKIYRFSTRISFGNMNKTETFQDTLPLSTI